MEWDQLFLKKEEWQRNTFDRIKNELISAKDNRFVRYENSEENHLVMIYGKSQVGKTTLILNMIGLRKECFPDVYETLRAKVDRGNSSTSTAIIYSKSDNDKYGCSLSAINELSAKEIQYFDKDGMIAQLKKIRQDVESNRVNPNKILFIYIPGNYFIQDSTINNISIMDMPGVESRNHKEDIHVQSLMTKYIPISSVCIIACRSNEIQSLETMVLPNKLDWMSMNHRFILVITHAYNDGTTKKYFRSDPAEHENDFYEYVKETYTQEIRKILGKSNQTEVYPIDVGDTLYKLCEEEKKREDEIIYAKDTILSDLRRSIVNHKGERLKSALMDLEKIAEHYGEDELHDIAEEIFICKDKIKGKEGMINKTEKYLVQLTADDGEKAEIEKDKAALSSVRNQFCPLINDCITNLPNQVEQYIESNALFKVNSDRKYLKDKDEALLSYLRSDIADRIDKHINRLIKLAGQADIDVDIPKSEIISKTDSNYILAEQYKFYPPRKGLFSKREKVFMEDIDSICNSVQYNINSMLNSYVSDCISETDKVIREKDSKIRSINSSISLQKDKIRKYHDEIKGFGQKIDELSQQRKEIEKKREQDRKTLKAYLKYAKLAYLEQRKKVVRQINESSLADDKILLILFLGLLDKDYQKITGGIHDGSHQYASEK